jgi:peptidoglycan hydrolase-like protein with peptidoglycan-binding domain
VVSGVGRSSTIAASTKTPVALQPFTVTTRDLATYTDVTGTLGYGDPITISEGGNLSAGTQTTAAGASSASAAAGAGGATSSAGGSGAVGASRATTATTTALTTTTISASNTVTRLSPEGTTINRGDVLYTVDNQPRVLFYGSIPAWRDLSAGVSPTGADVEELQANLVTLGYDPDHRITIDGTFGDATTQAVVRWQQDHGSVPNGVVSLGQIVFLAGPVRIATNHVDLGTIARAGTAVTDVTVIRTVVTVNAPAAGTVTAAAPAGTPVRSGTVLVALDGRPTVALTGTAPIFRDLFVGAADGEDVRTLEQDLVALGDDPDKAIAVDAHYDDATAAAVNRWAAALGIAQDGRVPAGRVIVVGDGLTVAAGGAAVGSSVPSGTPVVELDRSNRQVTANVSVTDRATMKVGDAVQVKFADGSQKPGTIGSIGAVAAKTSTNANAVPTVVVTVTLDDADVDPNLVATPVDVLFTKEAVTKVLAVPTGALIALKEGGFAVQVPDGGKTRLVAVKPGLYSDGWVQITSDGVAEGSQVMVPS